MRLTDLAPKWIGAEGRSGLGVAFECPCDKCTALMAVPRRLSMTARAITRRAFLVLGLGAAATLPMMAARPQAGPGGGRARGRPEAMG